MPVGWAERKGHRIEDEDVDLIDRGELDFAGAGVTVVDVNGETRVIIPGGGIPAAHKTSHQDGGSDEIVVTGLAGLLVTAQTPIDHDHTGDPGDGGNLPAYSPTGHDHDASYYTMAEVDDLITASAPTPSGSFILEGGHVVWETGLQFRISAARYYINSVLYESTEQTITLDAADPGNPRIDVIALDTSLTVIKITGTPAVNPSRPDISPDTQLGLTFVLVPTGATEPGDVDSLLLYGENLGAPTEWAATDSGATIDINSTNNPRTGTKDIEATTAVNNNWFNLAAAALTDISGYANLVLNIRSKAAWATAKSLRVSFRASTVVKGNYVSIDDGLYGFDSATIGAYQQVVIPMTAFAIPAGTLVDNLRVEIRGSGAGIGFYVDDISLQGGVPQEFVGITVEEADARYRKLVDDITEIAIPIDGGGSAITAGDKIDFEVGFNCTLVSWTLVGKTAGAIKLDVWRCTYAQYDDSTHPVDGDSICNGHEPEIVATGVKAQDLNLGDWADVTLTQGDILRVNVDSCTDMIRCTLNFRVLKT